MSAKQDALRSFSEEGLIPALNLKNNPRRSGGCSNRVVLLSLKVWIDQRVTLKDATIGPLRLCPLEGGIQPFLAEPDPSPPVQPQDRERDDDDRSNFEQSDVVHGIPEPFMHRPMTAPND